MLEFIYVNHILKIQISQKLATLLCYAVILNFLPWVSYNLGVIEVNGILRWVSFLNCYWTLFHY